MLPDPSAGPAQVDTFSFGVVLYELLMREVTSAVVIQSGDPQMPELYAFKVTLPLHTCSDTIHVGKHLLLPVSVFTQWLPSPVVKVAVHMPARAAGNVPRRKEAVTPVQPPKYVTVQVAGGYRRPLSKEWPEALQMLVQDCWQQSPDRRPPMQVVAARMEELQRSGAVDKMDGSVKTAAKQCCSVM